MFDARLRTAARRPNALCIFLVLALAGCIPPTNSVADPGCQGQALETAGLRRLALVVGVGEYASPDVQPLDGPPADARRVYELLTNKTGGYGFPPANVCLLVNEQATTERFKQAFEEALVKRARPGDVAVVFVASHGSRTRDASGDEPDGYDETLMFYGARKSKTGELRDDEFNSMLSRLHARTRNVTIIIDACNSGSATRGAMGTYVARYQKPDPRFEPPGDGGTGGDPSDWEPQDLPGFVRFAAAQDGTSAVERYGSGVFTDALITALSRVGPSTKTYAQAARLIAQEVRAASYQIPSFEGDLDRPVFGNTTRRQPMAWDVRSLAGDGLLNLAGPPLPGLDRGAVLAIYAAGALAEDTQNPAKAKATVEITEFTGVNAVGRVVTRPSAGEVREGDLAVLVLPSNRVAKFSVHLRAQGEGRLTPEQRAAIRAEIQRTAEAHLLIDVVDGASDFEISQSSQGELIVRGPENKVRKRLTGKGAANEVAHNLWQHARQQALLHLGAQGGGEFTDNSTLRVQLVPTQKQPDCAPQDSWRAPVDGVQVVPLCQEWQLRVEYDATKASAAVAANRAQPLLIGALILSTTGSIFALPEDQSLVTLQPGESYVFPTVFFGSPPLDIEDVAMVFGTYASNPIPWYRLADDVATRAADLPKGGPLYRALHEYLQPNVRGVEKREREPEDTPWTITTLRMKTAANLDFLKRDALTPATRRREYTIPAFDIRPYLPEDHTTALFKVLSQADGLARWSAASFKDGVPYKQHDWSKPSDADNLQVGIDCSRSIWFAFTRAGLPYNSRRDAYLSTTMMVGEQTPMRDLFDRCEGPMQLGDVLVYRDEGRQVGHTVMVIDPDKRIAWGASNYDGNVKQGMPADTGVEYQIIRNKKDWERWDRSTMTVRECWRYRAFREEAGRTATTVALTAACDERRKCGRLQAAWTPATAPTQ